MQLHYDPTIIRTVVLEVLREDRTWDAVMSYDYFYKRAIQICEQHGIQQNNNGKPVDVWEMNQGMVRTLRSEGKFPISDVLWDMVIEGILRPGTRNRFKEDLQSFHLTEYGSRAIRDPNSPFDPTGCKRYRKTVARVGGRVMQ